MWIEVCLHVHVSEAKTSNTSQVIRKIQFEHNVKRIANLIFNWHIIDFLLLPYLTRNNLCEKIFHENLSGRTFITTKSNFCGMDKEIFDQTYMKKSCRR